MSTFKFLIQIELNLTLLGHCRHGDDCRFLHTPSLKPGNLTLPSSSTTVKGSGGSHTSTQMQRKEHTRQHEKLAKTINAIRAAEGETPLPADSRNISKLLEWLKMSEEDIEEGVTLLGDCILPASFSDADSEYMSDDSYTNFHDGPPAFKKAAAVKYTSPVFPATQTVRYNHFTPVYNRDTRTHTKPAIDWSLLDALGILNLEFGPKFSIHE